MNTYAGLPIAVIGAGPVGLAAAAHLIARSLPVKLYEAGETIGANVQDWAHVRLFSPWRYNIDRVSAAILSKHGWQEPPGDVLPTGHDLVEAYLKPLAAMPELTAVTETRARIGAISRRGISKDVSDRRGEHPFALTVDGNEGRRIDLAGAVIDASGTWNTPNPLGASGMPAVGESELVDFIRYGIPDILGAARGLYTGKRVLVIGGGHSAANALLDLARLSAADPNLRLSWAVRGQRLDRIFGGGAADQLPARGKLGSDLRNLIDNDRLTLVKGFAAESIECTSDGIVVSGRGMEGALALDPVDQVIVATGQRPDLNMVRELRLDLDPWLESSRLLGPMIDPNIHSCGTVPPHGFKELTHPEPGYFAVGAKSYGRAPTFLMATGYEQVRSVVASLAGDETAASDVRLVLPETGVCSTQFAPSAEKPSGCCAPSCCT